MKEIGKRVCQIRTGENNPRNGESSFLRLKDGSILCAFTQYIGDSGWDDGTAQIAGVVSSDEGETWSAPFVLFPMDEGAKNNMSVTLLRMGNGDLGAVYLRKQIAPAGELYCMPVFRRSEDEGKTWSDWVFCLEEQGYYCGINDGVIRLKNGRILIPVAHCGDGGGYFDAVIRFGYSDDDGKTWGELPARIRSPYENSGGLQEPGVLELEDGTLWAWFRTVYGFQYQSVSHDGGETWTQPMPAFAFTSPDSPMRVRRAGKYTVAIFNPEPYVCTRTDTELWGSPKRTPLVCAFSLDGGKDFASADAHSGNGGLLKFTERTRLLESDRNESFCYPAMIETKDGFLAAYYYSAGTKMCLTDTIIKKVYFSELADLQ